MRRAVMVLTLASFAVGLSAVALRYLSPSLFRSAQEQGPSLGEAEASRDRVLQANEEAFAPNSAGRPVDPYSVVRGGGERPRSRGALCGLRLSACPGCAPGPGANRLSFLPYWQ